MKTNQYWKRNSVHFTPRLYPMTPASFVHFFVPQILEYYILNGPKPDVIEQVIKDLKNPQRLNPTDLDVSMVSHFRKVLDASSMDHTAAAAQFGRN